MTRVVFALGILVFGCIADSHAASTEIIPDDRRVTWRAGIPGGMPQRGKIFCDVTKRIPGSKNVARADGVHDDSQALLDAINFCPKDQVVYLPAGTYKLENKLSLPGKSHFTLRGDGPEKTILVAALTNSEVSVLHFGRSEWQPTKRTKQILSGALKGSTNMVLNNVNDLESGRLILIDQLNDGSLVKGHGIGGTVKFADRLRNGTRNLSQIVKVTSVKGMTVNFWPPLNWTFSETLKPEATPLESVRRIGLEDFKISNTTGMERHHFFFDTADECWMKNVESEKAAHWHLMFYQSLNCEVRGSFFHEAKNYTVNGGYGLEARMSTGLLIENNILHHLYASMLIAACNGCVFSYNLVHRTFNSDPAYMITGFSACHGAHPFMNLWEGNVGNEMQTDAHWGSSSHQTFFRNHFTGTDEGVSQNRKAISFDALTLSNSVVGNVLGTPGINWIYQATNIFPATSSVIYRLGFPNVGNNRFTEENFDSRVETTLLRHGNFDYASNKVLWEKTIAQTNLPPSLYLNVKPSWWGDAPWPAIGPDLKPMSGAVPAQTRFAAWRNSKEAFTPSAPASEKKKP